VLLLNGTLATFDGLTGTAVAHYRAIVLGRLAHALLDVGDRREAARKTKEALELCRSAGDEEGIRTYTKNLETIGTYQIPADGTDTNVTVSFTDGQGRPLALDELGAVRGKVAWKVSGAKPVPPQAERLHQEGRAAGASHDYDAALSLFSRAAELAPSWAYPVYDRAFTHLLRHEFEAALRDYRKTLELAPSGFFTAEAAVDTLSREFAGEFHSGLYAAFAMLEHLPTEERGSIAAQLVEKFPSFAPGWCEHARHVTDPREQLTVVEHGLAARPDRCTRGFLMIMRAMATSELGDRPGAIAMLQQLATGSGESYGTRAAAELVLAKLSSQSPD